jgi:acyl-[acyl-carrier-protein]-phospholipid O-acyltransferase / long-chain-fatty-acid--[acyl-carrier-protein] ligase
MSIVKRFLQWIFLSLYKLEIRGLENLESAGQRVLIVANHTSFLDAALLAIFLPRRLTFAVNTYIAQAWWIKPLLALVKFFPMDPTNPLSTKSLIRYLQQDETVVIFPEGRITVTGALMKIYQGPGMVADKAHAKVLPIRIEGAQYSPFSRLRGRVRIRWFPKITITLLAAQTIHVPNHVHGRDRRTEAGRHLADIMTEMMYATGDHHRTLFDAVLDAREIHGGSHIIAEDIERKPLKYRQLVTRSLLLGELLSRYTRMGEYVGVLLPNSLGNLITFMGLHVRGRVPAMLNFSVGAQAMQAAIQAAKLRMVFTSRRFIKQAKLDNLIEAMSRQVEIHYLEDLRQNIGWLDVLKAILISPAARVAYNQWNPIRHPDEPAVVLFTSGSEGLPKGVVLSHRNLLANKDQLAARVDFHAQDIILNALPMFHSFGLSAATLLPVTSGIRTFFYPSPLHYRIIPEVAYDVNATILFGTNTFLAGYARFAHPYDFYSVRYVFAGAEKLQEETRRTWAERFGKRIFEGYGATETSPVLAVNTPIDYRPGSVGRLLPSIQHHLSEVPGIHDGGRLSVKGPNVMLGYLKVDKPGELQPAQAELGPGWYDTGDIVHIDNEGFVHIRGRAKRFAKIAGEMISLAAVEDLASKTWPEHIHAVVSLPDPAKGEQLVLLSTQPEAQRRALSEQAKQQGLSELHVPKNIFSVKTVPLLGTGKIDYGACKTLAEKSMNDSDHSR